MLLDQATVDRILAAPKRIEDDVRFEQKQTWFKARAAVLGVEDHELFLELSWNATADKISVVLIVKRVAPGFARIYGADVGTDHHNPTCDQAGDPHRHDQWTEKHGERMASRADDLVSANVRLLFDDTLKRCNITFAGTFTPPAPTGTLLYGFV